MLPIYLVILFYDEIIEILGKIIYMNIFINEKKYQN
jgi:hypothetical protein